MLLLSGADLYVAGWPFDEDVYPPVFVWLELGDGECCLSVVYHAAGGDASAMHLVYLPSFDDGGGEVYLNGGIDGVAAILFDVDDDDASVVAAWPVGEFIWGSGGVCIAVYKGRGAVGAAVLEDLGGYHHW